MEDAYITAYLAVALVSLLIVIAGRRRWGARGDGLRLPPGPWQLPVIGSLHHLILAGKLPHRAMRDLARRHGPAMLLQLGQVKTLVVSSREGAREVMKNHDTMFATRPLSTTMRVLSYGGQDIVFAPYGEYWRQLRKIAMSELFTARRVLSFRDIREEEVATALRAVGEAAAAARTVEMRGVLSTLVTDSTARAVIGDRCRERDAFLRELDRINIRLLSNIRISVYTRIWYVFDPNAFFLATISDSSPLIPLSVSVFSIFASPEIYRESYKTQNMAEKCEAH